MCAVVLLTTGVALAQTGSNRSDEQRCAQLGQLKVAITTLETRLVTAGSFAYPKDTPPESIELYKSTPQFCRVTAHAHPSSDSDILIEIWLPTSGWNGRLQGVGNGGFAGAVPLASLAAAVKRGYAVVGTNTG